MADEEKRLLVSPGVDLALATSALTKSLRVGAEAEALFWALKIEKRYPWYLWRRLGVFAAEDVGIADTHAVTVVVSLRTVYEQAKKESRAPTPDPALLGLAVLYLARAPKSREASEFAQAIRHAVQDEGWRAPVPDEAIDLHTAEGRERMPDENTRLRHWLNVASRTVGEVGPVDWVLWIRRWAVRRGALDRDEVEAEAEQWDAEGRLRWGLDGYRPAREEHP